MNKLTKQLLSLGLSVVTVAGMVSPVLADDEVNAVEPTEETTAATEQSTEEEVVNELVTRTITLHITKDGQTTSTEFNLDVNATDDYVTSYIELTHSYECGLFFIKPSSLLHLILS